MANWNFPTLTTTYTSFLSNLKDRDTDLALQFDGPSSLSNLPVNAIRWDSAANRWKKWNGSSWAELTSTYALTGLSTTGNAAIGGTLTVTGTTTLAAATATTPATGDTSTAVATTTWVRNQAYATLSSPALSGTPTAPTAGLSTNTTQLATTAFTLAQIANDAPTKTGTGASGTWAINISGNAATSTTATTAQALATANSYTINALNNSTWYSFNDLDRNADSATYYPNAATRSFRWFFANAPAIGTGGNYAGVLHFSPWIGTTASTGDASYQLAFGSTAANGGGVPQLRLRKGIDTTWNSWYDILTSANYNTYSPTLTGTGASGTWGINISGSAASASTAALATEATVADDNASGSTYYPLLAVSTPGNSALKTSTTKLSFVPDTGTLSATRYLGNGTNLSNFSTFAASAGNTGDLPVAAFGNYFSVDVVATGTRTLAWFSVAINHQNTDANDFIMGARIYNLTAGGAQVGAADTGHSTAQAALAFNSVLHTHVTATTTVGSTYRFQIFLYKAVANGPTFPAYGRITGLFL
jgi:hypothetical protein